ncbi:CMRF35-like molecule 5 [Triplophysa rosa]|uniref:CMRF35-like molecule 5 n=1 Tax=Triplophysa rosa TaxID=992332 RepID=UPI002545E50B|nr:CMRF35-like molecule 5 [Triplophysa rosa]XP_057194179.1 CMRF35-like molecule 5 [Triplophysa rosa]XP_057194180.1 CMRF35-like molecule 5 [Triplophysa rosa]
MKICCVVCVWIFLTEIRSSSTNGIEMHGYTGKQVTISCQHSWAWSNRKYFCTHPCKDEDVLVSSDRSPNGRFSLKYLEKGTFTVTITDLQESDSGIYYCGVDRVGADTYEKVNLRVSKDTTQPLPISTRQQESQFATSSRTSRSSTLEHTTQVPSVTVSSVSVNISLYAVGGLIAVVILVCGPVAVCHYRKIIKTLAGLVPVPATPVDHNEDTAEEDTNVYENDVQDTRSSKQMKSKMLKSKVPKSHSHSVYENVELKPGQSDVIYGNL